ncbi:uncharacterized protein [Eurosta solidaginis]|uniref:uncharacterized protein n=1 Tax=Eurosta solidaginis TaxID=178769 RepID=UPI003530F560
MHLMLMSDSCNKVYNEHVILHSDDTSVAFGASAIPIQSMNSGSGGTYDGKIAGWYELEEPRRLLKGESSSFNPSIFLSRHYIYFKDVLPLPEALETCTQTDIGSRNSQTANSNSDEDILDITEFTSGRKLVSHYNYIVGDLKRKGLIKSELSHKDKSTRGAAVVLATSKTFCTDDIDNHLTILGSSEKQPDVEVLNSWQITLQYRRTLLTQNKISLNDYYIRFPCLKGELGLRLIESDFNQLYPSKQNTIITNWSNFKNKIINLLLTTRRPKVVEEVAIINTLHLLREEDKDAIIWHFLPRLISAPYIQKLLSDESERLATKKRKVTKRRVTVAEARYSSFLIVPNISEIDDTLKRRQEYLSKNNISCQPIAVLVRALDKVEDSYVYIEDKRHRTKSTLAALDFTFKSFFSLNCEYPCAAIHVWTLLQKILYEINLVREFSSISLNDFITDFEQME